MLKKVLLGAFLLFLALSIGLFLWARAVFTHDNVRAALAEQLSKSLGQPVEVGSIAATIYPRVTVNLGRVSIGKPARIQIQTLHIGADLGALLSRRIEHARLELSGARVELPLPPMSFRSSSTSGSSGNAPVALVSIDEIILRHVEIVSGGRTLTGDVDIVPAGKGLLLRKVTLGADNATIEVTGSITDLAGPAGEVAIRSGAPKLDQLLAFANDFATGSGIGMRTEPGSAQARPTHPTAGPRGAPLMDIAASLAADRATMGTLTLDKLAATSRITADRMTLEPVRFGLFGGRYDGSIVFTLGGAAPGFKLNAGLRAIDMAAASAFAGSPGLITGRLSGKLNVAGRGTDASTVIRTARGTARVEIVDGIVKNLGLVRSILVATSGRSGAAPTAAGGSRDEPFARLGATLTIANGSATTKDLLFESKDLLLSAAGSVRLDGSAIDLTGQVQLSEELSGQAGRDLVRYTQEGGRVTLPANIRGSAGAPEVRIDVASLARRALTDRAKQEWQKALKKGLRGLFKK